MIKINTKWDIASISCNVVPVMKSKFIFMLYTPFSRGGAVIDDDIIVLDIVFRPPSEAAKYGASARTCDEPQLTNYMEEHRTPNRKVWNKSTAPMTYMLADHDVPGEYRCFAFKRKVSDDTNLVSRISGAYGQTLYAALQDKDIDHSKLFYNIIRGVEIGAINQSTLTAVLKSIEEEDLRKIKDVLGTKKLSVKTLYNDIKGQ